MKKSILFSTFLIGVVIFSGCGSTKAPATKDNTETESKPMNTASIYDITINSLGGEALDLSNYKGKKILFVNVASKCGYTPQYEDLEKLFQEYGDKLMIIGVPCNQFGGQEPGTHDEIADFCQKNYGVTFTMTEKVDVKGENQHPLYKWLTSEELNGVESSTVKWNFHKFLVDEDGKLLESFGSAVKPFDEKITSYL